MADSYPQCSWTDQLRATPPRGDSARGTRANYNKFGRQKRDYFTAQLRHAKGCIATRLGPNDRFRSHVTYCHTQSQLRRFFSSNFWGAESGNALGGISRSGRPPLGTSRQASGLPTPCYDQFSCLRGGAEDEVQQVAPPGGSLNVVEPSIGGVITKA